MKKATLYSTETCPNCKTAQSLLTLNGYSVDYLVIGKDLTKEEFWAKNPTVRGVPYAVIGDNTFEGLNNIRKYLA